MNVDIGAQEVFQIVMLLIILKPVFYYMKIKYSIYPENKNEVNDSVTSVKSISVILPMRNESKNVRRKLESIIPEIIDSEIVDLIIANSSSRDDTEKIANQVLKSSKLSDKRWKIVNFKIPGKNIALNGVLETINSEIIVISDADADVHPGWLETILKRFEDNELGVISGMEIVNNENRKFNSYYRENSNLLRIKESEIDSTPVLEGSLLAWKKSALGEFRLNENVNADDAQIGLAAIRNGFRAVVDRRITFNEFDGDERSIRNSIRRSQGLSSVLIRNYDLGFSGVRKNARSSIKNAIFLYVFFPWAFLLFILNSVISFSYNPAMAISWEILSVSSAILISFTSQGRSLITGCLITMIAHFQLIVGKNYSNWDPSRN